MSDLGNIRQVTPSDTAVLEPFKYIQVGVSGDVELKAPNGEVVIVSAELLDRMAIVPVGINDQILTTNTTASDIYVWG